MIVYQEKIAPPGALPVLASEPPAVLLSQRTWPWMVVWIAAVAVIFGLISGRSGSWRISMFKLLVALAVLSAAIVTPVTAQQVISEPGLLRVFLSQCELTE